MQNQQLTYQYERGYERLTDRDNGEDLTPTWDTVARLKAENDRLNALLAERDFVILENGRLKDERDALKVERDSLRAELQTCREAYADIHKELDQEHGRRLAYQQRLQQLGGDTSWTA